MRNPDYNSFLSLANVIHSKYNIESVTEQLSVIAVAKALSPEGLVSNIADLNKIIDKNYPELRSEEDISSELINSINELGSDYKTISTFLFDYLSQSNRTGVFGLSTEISKELAKLIKLPHKGDIASLDCSGISLLKEAILQNKFEGNIHLFCQNKNALRMAFLHLYPVNKNIILHNCLEAFKAKDSKEFDFIYSLPPLGLRKRDNPIYTQISQASVILKENGQLLLVVGTDFLFRKEDKQTRELILDNFNVDFILNCLGVFRPFSGIGGAIILLNKDPKNEANIFVADINLLEKNTFEDLDVIIKNYSGYKTGKLVKSVSPLMNQVHKEDLWEDFVVARFDPKLSRLQKHIIEKYELKPLSDLCEIINGTRQYGPKDYLFPKSNSSVKYIRVQDLKDGKINIYEAKNVERKSETEILTQLGDLLISVSGTIGKVASVDEESSDSLPSNSLVILKPYKDLVDSNFLLLALQSEYVVGQIIKNIRGETISHLSINSLRLIEIPVLPLDEQKRAAHHINKLQEELAILRSRAFELEHRLQHEINRLF